MGGRGVGLLDRQVAVVAGAVEALGVGATAGEVFLPSMAIKMMIMFKEVQLMMTMMIKEILQMKRPTRSMRPMKMWMKT